ncbi:MAG: hypothetical protein OXE84_14580 [Rhodobacteraceae bacterium]|nr:hypothetical protein [Paracoccaceae bacterium]MCY4327669.1 hypothetical protein [Paracoccaceae bacterium]
MTPRHSDISVAKTDTDMAQARQRVANTMQTVATQLQGMGLVDDLVRLFREDPHQESTMVQTQPYGNHSRSGTGV